MTTDPSTDLLTVSQVCGRLPGKTGGRVAPSTVTRWIISGCPARDGARVRLRAVRIGSRWGITPTDLDTFFAALAAVPSATPTTPTPSRTDDDTAAAARRAAESLARRGA